MKSILLIGLGTFGRHIAMKLSELNRQVMAIDKCEESVNAVLPYVTNAQIGDSTNEEFLESRCFPRSRDKMKLVLKDLDIPFYDPILIIEKTQGRMAEDDFWLRIER